MVSPGDLFSRRLFTLTSDDRAADPMYNSTLDFSFDARAYSGMKPLIVTHDRSMGLLRGDRA